MPTIAMPAAIHRTTRATVSLQQVYAAAKQMGLGRRPGRPQPAELACPMDDRDRLEATVMLRKGASVDAVAAEFGQPVAVIEDLAQGLAQRMAA